ncbi:MAG: hypothetical protein ABFS42_11385 [Candidatus Krumholzibacteriota bacterium]
MKNSVSILVKMAVLLVFIPVLAIAGGNEHPGEHPKEQPSSSAAMQGLVTMCEESADARSARQAEKSLYDRLGGYEKIHALTKEIVRLHQENEDFRLMMKYVDGDKLAKSVADFVAAGTGGTESYHGQNMKAAHARHQFTEADFLSAGHDVGQAMKNLGHGENEINEVVCILVSMKDMVIYK